MAAPRRASDRGDAEALRAIAALRRGSFGEVAKMLSVQRGLDAEIRAHAVAATPDVGTALNRWRDAAPEDHVLHLLLAIRRLDDLPWLVAQFEQTRTAEQQHYDEVESLWRALEHLQWAQAGGVEVAAVWMAAVAGALAWRRAMPLADFQRCAAAAEEIIPGSVQTARWRVHLTDGDAVAAAEESARGWPPGDPRHAEVVTAHVAQYHDLLDRDKERAPEYWKRREVQDSVVAVNNRLASCEGVAASDASSLLAFVLPRTEHARLAIPHFDRLDGRVLTWPWAILRSPTGAYTELEQQARAWSLKGMFRRR